MEDDRAKTLTLTSEVHAAMVDRALTQDPSEACVLFSGHPGTLRVDGYHPMANVAAADEAWKLYVLDVRRCFVWRPRSMLLAEPFSG